eukprot:jgi/Chlat1/3933/Chrsp26S04193
MALAAAAVPSVSSSSWALEASSSAPANEKHGERPSWRVAVAAGEAVGLLGPNGAGKSTLFKALAGVSRRIAVGSVLVGGVDVSSLPPHLRARKGLLYLPQDSSIFRNLSVADNLRLVLEQRGGQSDVQREERIAQLLREFDLTHVARTKAINLSGGERRRTELARALAAGGVGVESDMQVSARVLLVDEPFAGVDPIGVGEMQSMLRRLCEVYNLGILITDHSVASTLALCDRAYLLHKGEIMAEGTPDELLQNDYARTHYLGPSFVGAS